MVTIDGAAGEGGGQILRTALSLSLVTGTPFRIDRIRAGRAKPGLLRQHLTAVRAAAAVGDARVSGDEIGSPSLKFEPGRVSAGQYTFSVGSAGSATLVLQTVLLPLLVSGGESKVTLEGGTHNPWAPPFDFLDRTFLPVVNGLGPRVSASLDRPGFYPAGGGAFSVAIAPAAIGRLDLRARGEIRGKRVRAIVANLPERIARREIQAVTRRLNWPESAGTVEEIQDQRGPGNVVFVEIESSVTEIFTGFGELGRSAESVGEAAANQARRYLAASDVPVGVYLADQLLTLLAVGAGGVFRTLALSTHSRTNIDVIRQFLNIDIALTEESRDVARVEVTKK